MDVEGNLAIIPIEEVQVNSNAQEQRQDEGYETKQVDVEMEDQTYRAYPTQEGTSFQGRPPAWLQSCKRL
ncbi:hypothetical protein Acr_27g0002280 [Actinidia rufa]|uniref:Uncharacterized protein n=1 Tax=Actinidia rufa TaxID=165716 RepID=A0A7J0H608_9ERIC|nr:hypothetical protein Acr_27g0002280 [Actinidia rufa]